MDLQPILNSMVHAMMLSLAELFLTLFFCFMQITIKLWYSGLHECGNNSETGAGGGRMEAGNVPFLCLCLYPVCPVGQFWADDARACFDPADNGGSCALGRELLSMPRIFARGGQAGHSDPRSDGVCLYTPAVKVSQTQSDLIKPSQSKKRKIKMRAVCLGSCLNSGGRSGLLTALSWRRCGRECR